VSLYNETKAEDGSSLAILPTPAIGGVGLLDDWEKSATIAFTDDVSISYRDTPDEAEEGARIFLIGSPVGHLGQTVWLREVHGREDGTAPPADLKAERQNGEFIRLCVADGAVLAVHDVSDGGIAVALAEMALAGGLGAFIFGGPQWEIGAPALFAEDQGLYLVTTTEDRDAFLDRAKIAGVDAQMLGRVGGHDLVFDMPERDYVVSLADLRAAHEGFFAKLMGSELTPEF
jgi:phosphoribosylformylglycinamidine (FGAM) synthase-like enzyme